MPLHPSLFRSKGSKQKLSTSTSTWEPFSMTSLTGLRTRQFCSRKRINVCISLRGIIRSTCMIFWRPSTKQSIIWYNSLCFFNSLRIVDAAKLHWVVKTASMLIGSEVTDGDTHYERKVLRWLQAALADDTCPLNDELKAQTSVREVSDMLLSLKTKTSTYNDHINMWNNVLLLPSGTSGFYCHCCCCSMCVCVCGGGGAECICVCVGGGEVPWFLG